MPRSPPTSSTDFITDVLAGRIGAAGVVTGDDFTYGKGRTGSIEELRVVGAEHAIAAEAVAPVLIDGERISSGRIRDSLAVGEVGQATRLLSRDYAIEGAVQAGDRRGRELGYPTANLLMGDYQRPKYGIYAVRVTLDDGRSTRASRAWAFARRSSLPRSCSRRICSGSRATFTAARSKSRSTPSSAMRRSSRTSQA